MQSIGVPRNIYGRIIKKREMRLGNHGSIEKEHNYELYGFEDISHLLESGYQSTGIYTSYIRDLSDVYSEGLEDNIALYRLSTIITEPATSQGRDKLIKDVQKYLYNNIYY